MTPRVLVRREGAVATLSLNRPEVMNAMDGETMIELRAAAEDVARDPSVRVVALSGEGPAFCAGGDVGLFHRHLDDLPRFIVQLGREMHFAMWALRRAPKPVLAVVHGTVAGAGFSLLCAADLAIAAEDTRFTLAYANIGASPDGGSSHFLPRLMGYKRAMQVTLLPDVFDAATARDYGIVNWTVPSAELRAEAGRIATRLAKGPTTAYGEAKRLMNASFERGMETQMEDELIAFERCARSEDLREGVTAFVEKRKPSFTGR